MTPRDILRREFDAEEGTFLLRVRCDLTWDWNAFRILTGAMYDVADALREQDTIERWIAEGFWYCDTWLSDWTSHPNFPRPSEPAYRDALALIRDLSRYLFSGENPYIDDTLKRKAKG